MTRVTRGGMTAKNRARLGQFVDDRALKLLLDLPARVFARYDSMEKATFKQAREVQNAAILAVLLEQPMRVGNVADLDLDRHFQRPLGRGASKWLVSILAHEVKNDETIDGEFTEETSARLDRYVAVFRPALAAHHRHLGRAMSLHVFRDGATTTVAVEASAEIGIAGDLLGHADPKTSEKYYNQARGVEARRRYHVALDDLRRSE